MMGKSRVLYAALPWVLASVAVGMSAGLIASAGGRTGVVLIAAALLALVVGTVVVRDPQKGLYLMLFALPLDAAGRIITSPVTVTVYHVALLLTLGSWLLHLLGGQEDFRPAFSAVDVGIAALVAAGLWSLPGSLAPSATLIAIVRLVFLWLFFLVFVTFMRDERTADRVLALLVITAAASSLLAVVQYVMPGLSIGVVHTQGLGGGATLSRPAAFFTDPNFLAAFLSVAVISGIGRAVHSERMVEALSWLAGAGAAAVGLAITLSRTGMVGVAVGVLVLVVTAPTRVRAKLIGILAASVVIIAILAPSAVIDRVQSIGAVGTDASEATRVYMVGSTVRIIGDNWVFGTGLDAFEQAYPPYRHPGSLWSILKPHQLPLAMWAEMGIAGLFAELAVIGGVVVVIRRRTHSGWNAWECIGMAGLLALLVQSLFQYYLYFEYLWLFLALTVAATRFKHVAEEVSNG